MSGTTSTPDIDVGDDDADKAGLSISVPQVAGGALASVITALAASFLGVAGTLIGAALGSVLSSIGTVVFGHSLIKAKRTLKKLPVTAADPAARNNPNPNPNPNPNRSTARRPASRRPAWQPVAVLAGCVFVAAMAAIWVTEVAIGHPISGGTSKGTSIGDVFHEQSESSPSPSSSGSGSGDDEPSPSGEGAPSDAATSPAAEPSQAKPGPTDGGAAATG